MAHRWIYARDFWVQGFVFFVERVDIGSTSSLYYSPAQSRVIQKSRRLKYEPSLEPLHISAKVLCLNIGSPGTINKEMHACCMVCVCARERGRRLCVCVCVCVCVCKRDRGRGGGVGPSMRISRATRFRMDPGP